MEKLKVYLDTSVISYLDQQDTPEKMADTQALWKKFEKGDFDIYLSWLTLQELNECPETKKNILISYLNNITYTELPFSKKIDDIANQIIQLKILTRKNYEDCQHIGAALINKCNCILSWNFKHIVNLKTVNGIRAISNLNGYPQIEIIPPSMLLSK